MEERKCVDCDWCGHFKPRQDEIERGLTLGCRYPNYEGYTDGKACCFFMPKRKGAGGAQ